MIPEKAPYQFYYEVYPDSDALNTDDKVLVEAAREETKNAYAPYSRFHVAAVARLANDAIVKGTNQENASYPVTICAERVLLSTATMLHPSVPIRTMAISYHSLDGKSEKPISPCGLCRQSLKEMEDRMGAPIRLLLTGMHGKVYVIAQASQLLPLSFGGADLK